MAVYDLDALKKAGFSLPQYDREEMRAKTKENPFWIHFGAGNIFRAFQANVVQNLLNEGALDRGLIVAEGFDYEIVEKMMSEHKVIENPTIDEIFAVDKEIREKTKKMIATFQ